MARPRSSLDARFAQVLRARRLKAGLTQEGLAELSGLHSTYISQLERGLKSPTLGVLEAIAAALKTRPHLLVKAAERLGR